MLPPEHRFENCILSNVPAGSCWAFAATAAIESMYLIKGGPGATTSTLALSPQQMVSCCNSNTGGCAYSQGCNGGYSDEAINYVTNVHQTTAARYPYSSAGGSTGTCNNNIIAATTAGQAVKLSGSASVISPTLNENAMMQAVAIAPMVM